MSSILDALKKSEADRQRAAGPTLLDLHVQPRKRGLPAWAIGLAVLLVGNGVLLAWLMTRHAPDATSDPRTAGTAPVAATLPAAAGAPPAPAAALPAGTTSAPSPMPAANANAAPSLPPGEGRAARMPAGSDAEDNPADEAPAVEPPPRRARYSQGAVQNYNALSATLPPLHLDLHFWSDVPAERYALINLHRVGEGDVLPEGPRVLEITRDGVVMEYEGREFVLGRE